jgi:hypothetical protein
MSYIKWILVLSNLPILAAAVYALFIYKKLDDILKAFTWYIFLTVIIQFPYLALWFYDKNNLPLLHLYVLLSFISLAVFYLYVLRGFISTAIILLVAVLFSCFTIFNSVVIQGIHSINSNALTVESVLVIILSLSTFIVLLNDDAKETRKEIIASLRWINSGLFIYYASDLLLFYFSKMMVNEFSTTINRYGWMLNSFFLTVMYICFIIGLWKRPKD